MARPKVTVLKVDDGWQAIYIDGKLVESNDNNTAWHLVDVLVNKGILPPDLIEFEYADDELDEQITNSGEFPSEL